MPGPILVCSIARVVQYLLNIVQYWKFEIISSVATYTLQASAKAIASAKAMTLHKQRRGCGYTQSALLQLGILRICESVIGSTF
jgi:hypothetical protein